MGVMEVLHMNKGSGETSYAKNSIVQGNIISKVRLIREEALSGILYNKIPESMGIVDMGCSTGPNVFQVIHEILDIIDVHCKRINHPPPEVRVFLNDLFTNDFNNIFLSLPAFYNKLKREKGAGFGPCFVFGMPGNFYGRLFPRKSLHFVHSSSSLHWLSEAPPSLSSNSSSKALNKGKLYISKSSPQVVLEAYLNQFQHDFSTFLVSRSEEMIPEGRMVLSFMGRSSEDPTTEESCHQWELLAEALMSMAREGLVEDAKIDSFNAPYYAPCSEEVKREIEKEGSFVVDQLEKFEIDWDGGALDLTPYMRGKRVAKTIRAVVEPMLESYFGGDIMDELFTRYAAIVASYLSETRAKYINMVVSLVRKA